MEGNNLGNREKFVEQAVTGYTKGNRQSLVSILLALIQIKYQNLGKSPFETHPTITWAFIATAGALGAMSRVTRAIPNSNYLPIAMHFSDILGALACSLLIFILAPPVGGFLLFSCALVFIRALHGSYCQIFELLKAFKFEVFNTFQQIFNRPHQADPQASSRNSTEQEGNSGVSTTV